MRKLKDRNRNKWQRKKREKIESSMARKGRGEKKNNNFFFKGTE